MGATARFAAKEYRQGKDLLLAVCDEECLGQDYQEGKLRLRVEPGFYDGRRIGEDEFEVAMQRATIANLVGKRTVAAAIRMGLVAEENVLSIAGVPHAQWALLF